MILNNANNIKYGAIQAKKIMRGDNLIWEALLLDLFPNATVAYSLRKLINRYDGYAIRVRRASDNAEINIGFLDKDLDITTLETFCSGTDGFVTTWYDQSGNENDAIQTTAIRQPKIVSSGVVLTKNSKPIIVGDNIDDEMTSTGFNNILQNEFEIFHVGESNGLDNNESIGWDGSDDFYVEPNSARGGISYRIFWRNRGTFTSNVSTYTNEQVLSNINLEGNDLSVEINTSNIGSIALTGTAGEFTNFFLFGNSNIASGNYNFQEVIIYPLNQAINRLSISENINNYYSIY